MSTTIHVGKHRVNTVAGSDGSAIQPGALSAVSSNPSFVTVTVDAQNNVTLTAVAPTPVCNITYSAAGYISDVESVMVPSPPSLVVTDGPEI